LLRVVTVGAGPGPGAPASHYPPRWGSGTDPEPGESESGSPGPAGRARRTVRRIRSPGPTALHPGPGEPERRPTSSLVADYRHVVNLKPSFSGPSGRRACQLWAESESRAEGLPPAGPRQLTNFNSEPVTPLFSRWLLLRRCFYNADFDCWHD
jgi:hypothetical protein